MDIDTKTQGTVAVSTTSSVQTLKIETNTDFVADNGTDKILQDDNKNKGNGEIVYGKTSNDKVFQVPQTSDMLTSVFTLSTRKSAFDTITLVVISSQILLFFILPSSIRRWIFLILFIFWRVSYNAGLGALLKYQSDRRGLVLWAKRKKIFDKEKGGKWYTFLKEELTVKMGDDYDFDTAPIEFNTWLLFRQLVDLILLNDFITYVCFALANFSIPENSGLITNVLRWVGGLFLLWFNVWVKADAHRVVKDFAWCMSVRTFLCRADCSFWYWGDFFFLVDQSLTFDGVFEMAPHPMYSIGYVGYYGISLMMASYTVLFVSLSAHAAQFAFLTFVENPHIDKTYNKPTPLNEKLSKPHTTKDQESASQHSDLELHSKNDLQSSLSNLPDTTDHCFRRDLIVFKNFDLLRSNDLFVVFMTFYAVIIPSFIMGASENVIRIFLIVQCLAWRVFHSYGLGAILFLQSKEKLLTKHYIKFGGTVNEAFANWKSIYNLSLYMTYVTFVSAAWKMYYFPEDWTYGTVLLRHTLGVLLIVLHIWTSVSIFEVLGDFGWFYGDFFLDARPETPYYTGIYRFLNNPEKLMGHTAFWGITLISNSWPIFGLTLFAQISNLLFLRYIESPHMRKLYGDKIRKEDGLTKTIKRVIKIREVPEISIVKRVVREVEKVVEETAEVVGEFVGAAKPKVQNLFQNSRDKFMISRLSEVNDNFDRRQYSISLILPDEGSNDTSNSNGHNTNSKTIAFQLGEPISLSWMAPKNHSRLDWIGIYKVTANSSKVITSVSSGGRFLYVTPDEDDSETSAHIIARDNDDGPLEKGEVRFTGDRLPWELGVYEFRYHHNDKHNVIVVSEPFEIAANAQYVSDLPTIERTLLTLVQRALDSDEELIPHTTSDDYKLTKEIQAKRIVYGIKMIFDVDFAWEVVAVDGNIERLARRIFKARYALLPFPDSSSDDELSPDLSDEKLIALLNRRHDKTNQIKLQLISPRSMPERELSQIETLKDVYEKGGFGPRRSRRVEKRKKESVEDCYSYNEKFNEKVSLIQADITKLKIDAIVNAANESLMGGGGVDGAIHRAAGPKLKQECWELNGCRTGDAKITLGYDLPAKHVIHTVGPMGEKPELLRSSYERSLKVFFEKKLKSIAFSNISTGVYGYPRYSAGHVAISTVRKWLEDHPDLDQVERIIFCVFEDENKIDSEDNDGEKAEAKKDDASVSSTLVDDLENTRAEGLENVETKQDETSTTSAAPIETVEKEISTTSAPEDKSEDMEVCQGTSTSPSAPVDSSENTETSQANQGGDSIASSSPMDGLENTGENQETPTSCMPMDVSDDTKIDQEASASNDSEEKTEKEEGVLDPETIKQNEETLREKEKEERVLDPETIKQNEETLREKETKQETGSKVVEENLAQNNDTLMSREEEGKHCPEETKSQNNDTLMSREEEGKHCPEETKSQNTHDSIISPEVEQIPSDSLKADSTLQAHDAEASSQEQESEKGVTRSSL
ncbi:2660_t:CDS:10 [Acaulospora morrowiae]|uniref:Phosphatidylethanolamine N-methyltransferase n=1 Tax=Acaulospora morrowiae TaxID=94023 RepID=A0A9N8VK98_9GLOM|nr:2660_t:CDS:10 [Acaulospora morrowiae]